MKLFKKNTCSACNNHNCFIKQHFDHDCVNTIEDKKLQYSYKPNQYIFRESHLVNGIFFIKNGKVKIFSTGINDRYHIVRLAKNGDILAYGSTIENYSTSAMTIEDSVICFFQNPIFYDVCLTNNQILLNLMNFFAKELEKTRRRIKYMAQMNVREKVAEALCFIKEAFGVNENNELNVYISRQDIASIAGTTKELVIRNLSEFENEKLIAKRERGRKIVLLNENKLHEMVRNFDSL